MINLTINGRDGLLLLAGHNNLKEYVRDVSDTSITFNGEVHPCAIESYLSDLERLFNVTASLEYRAYSIVISIQ
jgi:hypothetical protein